MHDVNNHDGTILRVHACGRTKVFDGKGNGMVAECALSKGTVIFTEVSWHRRAPSVVKVNVRSSKVCKQLTPD